MLNMWMPQFHDDLLIYVLSIATHFMWSNQSKMFLSNNSPLDETAWPLMWYINGNIGIYFYNILYLRLLAAHFTKLQWHYTNKCCYLDRCIKYKYIGSMWEKMISEQPCLWRILKVKQLPKHPIETLIISEWDSREGAKT